jgi:hypothetical protein
VLSETFTVLGLTQEADFESVVMLVRVEMVSGTYPGTHHNSVMSEFDFHHSQFHRRTPDISRILAAYQHTRNRVPSTDYTHSLVCVRKVLVRVVALFLVKVR